MDISLLFLEPGRPRGSPLPYTRLLKPIRRMVGATLAVALVFLLKFFQKGDPAGLPDKAKLLVNRNHGIVWRIVPGFDEGASMLPGISDASQFEGQRDSPVAIGAFDPG